MPDGHLIPSTQSDHAQTLTPYFPPIRLILEGLDTDEMDLNKKRVSVSASFLRFLIGEIVRPMKFDDDFYRSANPDVEAALLAGDVATLHEHFVVQGYFERRQPHALQFDAAYYDDLARVFDAEDEPALRQHYVARGWQEGRVAVWWQRSEADRWVAAARAAAAEGNPET